MRPMYLAAEVLERRLFAERAARPEEGHDNDSSIARHADITSVNRCATAFADNGPGFWLCNRRTTCASRSDDRSARRLDLADLTRNLRTLVHEPQQLVVDGVDAVAQLLELIGHAQVRHAGR